MKTLRERIFAEFNFVVFYQSQYSIFFFLNDCISNVSLKAIEMFIFFAQKDLL